MIAELIYRPTSGQFPEIHFGDITTGCLWIKFTDKEYNEWVGSFAKGWDGFMTKIFVAGDKNISFVITGGKGYLIDILNRKQLNITNLDSIQTAIIDNDNNRILFSDGLNIMYVDFSGQINKFYDKYFYDEIEFLEIKNNKLLARYWYYQKGSEHFNFELDLSNKEINDNYYTE